MISWHLFFGPVAHLMPYWGIFRFGGSLWIFAEVTCSRIDDSMLSDLRLIIHFDAIQGHISVRMRFTDHGGVACLSLFGEMYAEMMIYSLSSRWFLSEAYREPSSQARAFRCLDVVMLPSEGRLFDMWVWFSCRHRWFKLICFFFLHVAFLMPHWGIFPISVEMWRSPTDLHDHPQLWDTRQVVDSISFCVDTSRSLSWVVQLDYYSLI